MWRSCLWRVNSAKIRLLKFWCGGGMDTVLEAVPAGSCECFGVLHLQCFGGAWHY